MIGSWFTLIRTGIGRGKGTGAKPRPGGDRRAAAMSNLTNFLASCSWAPQWACCAMSDKLKTIANMNEVCDFIFGLFRYIELVC